MYIFRETMKRIQIYLTKRQLSKMKQKSYDLGISTSELIRRILDRYIDDETEDISSNRKQKQNNRVNKKKKNKKNALL